jgi:hypothetical protein
MAIERHGFDVQLAREWTHAQGLGAVSIDVAKRRPHDTLAGERRAPSATYGTVVGDSGRHNRAPLFHGYSVYRGELKHEAHRY